jgi:beta-glucosidase
LKNQDRTLPLSKTIKSVAVLGPLADEPYEVLGTWNRDGQREDTVTPLAAIRAMLGHSSRVHYAKGLSFSRSRDTNGISLAVEAARNSEVALLFVGEEALLSGEAHSRAHLDLPGAQNALIEAVAATGKPVVLVVLAGRPLCLGDMIAKSKATLYAWHPGTMCGPALADLLFGVESPSGKLTITFPQTEGQIPIYYAHKNTGRPPTSRKLRQMDEAEVGAKQSSLGDVSRYIDIGYMPLYPFGFGLSYTQFRYANLRLSSEFLTAGDTLKVSVDLSNAGTVEADEIAQLYVRDLVGSITRPVKELKGFQRVRLKPGETRQLTFELPIASLRFHNREMKFVVEPGTFYVWVGTNSDSGVGAQFEVTE